MEPDKQPVPAPLTGEVLPPQEAKPMPMNPLAVISMILGIASASPPWRLALCSGRGRPSADT